MTKIIRPSKKQVEYYLKSWDKLERYKLQESSLKKLFTQTYPRNNDLDEVLIKVCALNDFYSTSIYHPVVVAKHIVKLSIDDKLDNDNLSVVNEVALIKMNDGKTRNFYSFATKYCSHHKPTVYPIYDSFVEKFLLHFKNKDGFDDFKKVELRNFERYHSILEHFSKYYALEMFDLKQIDKYLWQAGKKYFPKNY